MEDTLLNMIIGASIVTLIWFVWWVRHDCEKACESFWKSEYEECLEEARKYRERFREEMEDRKAYQQHLSEVSLEKDILQGKYDALLDKFEKGEQING